MIPDPQIVDPGPDQLEFSPTNPDNPYTISYTLPAGAPEPPEVVFTPVYDDAGKVISLRWEFPGWDFYPGAVVTVTMEFKLAPGARRRPVIENRAGATGTRPDLACSPGGSAARHGDRRRRLRSPAPTAPPPPSGRHRVGQRLPDREVGRRRRSLGWMNSHHQGTGLPLEDPGLPAAGCGRPTVHPLPVRGQGRPGQGFDFYLRLTNAGTNPATEVRLVDVFPAPGDTGCHPVRR